MATIGDIVVQIRANTRNLTAGIKKSRVAIRSFSTGIKRSLRVMGSWQAAIAGLAGAAGFGALITSQFKTIDALAKTADKLGVSTEALASLRHAAEQTAGVTTSTLDMALQRMTRRISEAAVGTGEAQGALRELGLSAAQLNAMSPADAFAEIAESMKFVTNDSDRLRLAFKLFDSEGAQLVNTLRIGRDGLNKFAEDARKLGIAVSRVDAARVEAANDAFDRMQKAIGGLVNAFTIELAPAISSIATSMTAWLTDANGKAAVLKETFAEIARGMRLAAAFLNGGRAGLVGEAMAISMEKIGANSAPQTRAPAARTSGGAGPLGGGFDAIVGSMEMLTSALRDRTSQSTEQQLIGAMEKGSASALQAIERARTSNSTNEIMRRQLAEAKRGNTELRAINRTIASTFSQISLATL